MVIIKRELLYSGQHHIISMDQARKPWLPGYIEVPAHLEQVAWASCGYCDLDIQDGVLVGITPTEKPVEPVPEPVMTTEEAALDMLADMDYRLGLLELGVQTKEETL